MMSSRSVERVTAALGDEIADDAALVLAVLRRERLGELQTGPVGDASQHPGFRRSGARAPSRRRSSGSISTRFRSSTGSANTGRQPGNPSKTIPDRKDKRTRIEWGIVSATTRRAALGGVVGRGELRSIARPG